MRPVAAIGLLEIDGRYYRAARRPIAVMSLIGRSLAGWLGTQCGPHKLPALSSRRFSLPGNRAKLGGTVSGACPVGEYGFWLRRLSGVPGPVQDGSGAMRCSRTQLDSMGHDPKPATR
jgi:hypothetical protein